ncbi:ABC transporter substrate-binding protein [Thermodesulfobacteriota bacterium]
MKLSKESLRKTVDVQIVIVCTLLILPIVLAMANPIMAASKPTTVAEIALYQGPDREKLLIEGAKKEGKLTFYNSHTWFRVVFQEFEKKYPFIKVLNWRSSSRSILKRVVEEYAAGRFLVDAIETSPPAIQMLHREGIFQEYYSPEIRNYGDQVKEKGETGVYYLADREIYIGLGFNTNLISPTEAPKGLKDLLDPRWKGKMSITGSTTTIRWIGNALDVMGRDFIEKLSRQDIRVHNLSGAALANLVVAGEVPLSPTIFDSNIYVAKRKGALVAWRPIEPVVTNVGYSGMTTKAAHPHASLLLLDYLHSKEGQKVIMQGGLSSPRENTGSVEQKFKKTYLEANYPVIEEYAKKINEWESLLKRLFMKRR